MNQLKKKNQSKLKWLWISLLLVFVSVAITGTYLYTVYNTLKTTVNETSHETIEAIDTEVTKNKVENRESLNVLLLGVDERKGDSGRSDTMIVMTMDPTHSRLQMVSIPRDTRTEIIGKGVDDKINHAYAFGGSEMSVATVENFLDIDLDYYIRVNMEGLEQLVDAVGGVTVNNAFDFKQEGHTFTKGRQTLDGKQALSYVRMRKQDPEGDVGRNERQRQVIQAVLDNGATLTSLTKIHKLIEILGGNMITNMKFSDMENLMSNYRNVREDTSTYQVTGQGKFIDDIWYLMVSEEEILKIKTMITEYGG
ncbi:transcriptional regulator LytR [Sporosarcina sp. BI001-red]|uniref:LCP family glycopolymer transferase n=1 Tax=Sporosarcina sp. BI001-red TaxID=2282866 RepID=UPI000E24CE65|nr:LCP family protein [Sporosarcina sp. BI001-red]REB08893.1 transcriptional regulator LytR [Sporosarcina sp. BI001-red]